MPLPADSLGSTLVPTLPPDNQAQFYEDYQIGNGYSYDAGLMVLPVAGPDGTPPRIIKTHAAIGRYVKTVKATKVDTPPLMPKIGINTVVGDVFLEGALSIPLPQINSAQNGFNYFAEAKYTYVQPGAPRGYNDTDTFQTGEYPYPLPLLDSLAALNPQTTIGDSGDPDHTDSSSSQQPYSPDGQGTQSPAWAWLSTTWLSAFFYTPTSD